ncbi:hypothetical protein ACNHUS_31455 [Actinomycetes bacterium M1A6_2h]
MTRRWFVTGGTPGGFGVAFAEAALETGDSVALTSRRPHEPVSEPIAEYHSLLAEVRAAFVGMDGVQPGDPHRGARAVIAAMAQKSPPRRLVLGNSGFDAVTDTLETAVKDIRSTEKLSRSTDFPD